jgi:large subunit ribosomal protein L22
MSSNTYSGQKRFILQSPSKLRRAAGLVRGKSCQEALSILRFSGLRAAEPLIKKITEIVANASVQTTAEISNLYVSEIMVNEGPVYKRYKPRAQGRLYKIRRQTSHLSIKLKELQGR